MRINVLKKLIMIAFIWFHHTCKLMRGDGIMNELSCL